MDDDLCPKCGETAVVTGGFRETSVGRRPWFEPTGMRFFNFRLWGRGVSCEKPFSACLACGHVWSHLQPEDLRAFIDRHGDAEIKLKLSALPKVVPDQELA